eukprot:Skav206132  [mRNA]  locus=scaffold172:421468:424954:+ [translate_table: standard]
MYHDGGEELRERHGLLWGLAAFLAPLRRAPLHHRGLPARCAAGPSSLAGDHGCPVKRGASEAAMAPGKAVPDPPRPCRCSSADMVEACLLWTKK